MVAHSPPLRHPLRKMSDSTPTQRLLDLLTFLAGRRYPVGVDAVMRGVPGYTERWERGAEGDASAKAAAQRMFERDKAALRGLGIPVEKVPMLRPEEGEGYRIRRERLYLPYIELVAKTHGSSGDAPASDSTHHGAGALLLQRGEATAALEALRHVADLPESPFADAAASAYRKLTFDLEPADLPGAPLGFHRPTSRDGGARESMELVAEALRRRKRVRFLYHGVARGDVTHRDVAPWSLYYRGGAWYLVGHDALRDDVRVFRVGRMHDVDMNEASPGTPDFEVPADFEPARYAERDPWQLGPEGARPQPVRVRFRYPASLRVERTACGELIEQLDDGSAIRSFRVLDEDAFLRWILAFDGDATIELPAEWRTKKVQALANGVRHLHEGPPFASESGTTRAEVG